MTFHTYHVLTFLFTCLSFINYWLLGSHISPHSGLWGAEVCPSTRHLLLTSLHLQQGRESWGSLLPNRGAGRLEGVRGDGPGHLQAFHGGPFLSREKETGRQMPLCPLCLRFWEPISTVGEDEVQEPEMPGNSFLLKPKAPNSCQTQNKLPPWGGLRTSSNFTLITAWGSK